MKQFAVIGLGAFGNSVVKALYEMDQEVLSRIGADRVIFPERDMGVRMAHSLASSNVLDIIELSPDYSLVEVAVPEAWVNKSLKDINLRAFYGLNAIAIRRGTGTRPVGVK